MNDAPRTPGLTRRTVVKAAVGALALLALPRALARMPLLTGTEADAVALEFVPDASGLDAATQPRFAPGSRCAACYFYQGAGKAEAAPCTVFAGWRVPATGWCREFAPKS